MAESDIVVTGRRLPHFYDDGNYSGGSGGGGQTSSGRGGFYDAPNADDPPPPAETPPTDGSYQPPPTLSAQLNHEIEAALKQRVTQAINFVHSKLQNARGDLAIATVNNQAISIDEYYNDWLNLSFKIIFTQEYPIGFGGHVRNTGTGFESAMRNETLTGYDRIPGGLNDLVLHEAAHTTQAATEYYNEKYSSFLRSGGLDADWGTSVSFADAEIYANNIAKRFADQLSIPIMENPRYGY